MNDYIVISTAFLFIFIWITCKYATDKKFGHFAYILSSLIVCSIGLFILNIGVNTTIDVQADTKEEPTTSEYDFSSYPKVTVVRDKRELAIKLGLIEDDDYYETYTEPETTTAERTTENKTYIHDIEGNDVIIDYIGTSIWYTYAPPRAENMSRNEYVEAICRQLISYVMLNHNPPVLFNYVYLPEPVDNGDGTITYKNCEIMKIEDGRVRLTICVDATFQDDILISIPKVHMKDWR